MTATATRKSAKSSKANKKANLVKAKKKLVKARSPIFQAILENTDKRSWTSRAELVQKVGHLIPRKMALENYEYRIGRRISTQDSQKVQVERGKDMVVMLALITLCQTEKMEKRGRGKDEAEYRRLVDLAPSE